MNREIRSVAIIGGGPAGAALACHLLRQGRQVVLYDDGAKPDLVVGESLVPAVLPMLDRLGVLDRVAAVSTYKPGVSFTFSQHETIRFNFRTVAACRLPTYAYNVPRPDFDRILAQRAAELGAHCVRQRAKLERAADGGLRLAPETLAAAPVFAAGPPDLIVDASGRSRLAARTLDLPARVGPRSDVAHFAHYRGFVSEDPAGQVVITRLAAGWSWRIPLPGRLSVGVVINRDEAARLGRTPNERLEAAIDRDPVLAAAGAGRERISEVMTYGNYQLITEIGHGPGWVLAGDAFGFVDPMLSPGLMLALHSAELLAARLEQPAHYVRQMQEWLGAWMELVEYFYDGRMFAMYHTGMAIERKFPGAATRFLHGHVERNVACMACGAKTLSGYSRGLVRFLAQHGVWLANPAQLRIV